jgi:hypothetical protein
VCKHGFSVVSFITPANKHIHCHAGLDPASSPVLDSRFRENDDFDIYCCRSNNANERLPIAETGLGIQVVWRGEQIVLDTQDLLLYFLPIPKQAPSSFELRKENNPTKRGGFL